MFSPTETTPERDPRLCTKVKDDGTLCKAFATRSGMCAGHSGLGIAASPEVASAAARASAVARQEKAQTAKKRAVDLVRERYEQDAEAFYKVRRAAALDEQLPMADRLRAIEQIESRALGKPKESVTVDTQESEAEQALRALTAAERLALWEQRGLHVVDGD